MARWTVTFLFFLTLNSAQAQHWGVNTTASVSYSGLSQSVRAQYRIPDWNFSLGPKYNMSKNALPTTGKLGLSFETNYLVSDGFTSGRAFVLYEFLPLTNSRIHEVYVGYGIDLRLNYRWSILGSAGFGGYNESSTGQIAYALNGLAFCTQLGVTYRFYKGIINDKSLRIDKK